MTRATRGAILVTGAGGFTGRHTLRQVLAHGTPAIGLSRADAPPDMPGLAGAAWRRGPADGLPDDQLFAGVDAVIHTAGLAHRRGATAADHRRVNRDLALETARAAARAGVRRFVLVSSIAVYGVAASPAELNTDTPLAPTSAYGAAKAEAEHGLHALADETGLEVVVVRPALVCGAHAPGNLAALARAVARGLPLPLGSVANRRSLIEVGDLGDLLYACARTPAAAGRTYLAGDPLTLATPDIVREIAVGLGKPPRLWPCPPALLLALGRITGRQRIVDQLTGSLSIDPTTSHHDLGWRPVRGVRAGLRALGAAAKP